MDEAADPVGDDALGTLRGWYDPRRLLFALPGHLRLWALALGIVLGGVGFLIGWWRFSDTWTLSATLRLVPPAQALNVEATSAAYEVPDFRPEEVRSWFHRTAVYERLVATMQHKDVSVEKLKDQIDTTFERDALLFHVTYAGAASAEEAERTLATFCKLVIDDARRQARLRTGADEEYFRKEVGEARAKADAAKEALGRFVKESNWLGLEQQVAQDKARAYELDNRLRDAENRLSALRRRMEDVPALRDKLPPELPTGRSLIAAERPRSPLAARVEVLRDEVRRLAAIYTDQHPAMIAARDELARANADLQAEAPAATADPAVPGRPDGMVRNTLVDVLNQELVMLRLQEPQLAQDVDNLRKERAALPAPPDLPALAARFRDLSAEAAKYDALLRRLETRLAEIQLVAGQASDQLQTSDPANKSYAERSPKWLKVVLATLAGLFLGLGVGCLVAAIRALRDPVLRTTVDYKVVLQAKEVEDAPAEAKLLAEHRRWLQRMAEYVTVSCRRTLLVPSAATRESALIARELANQVARSGLKTLLIADAGLIGVSAAKGVSNVIDKEIHPEQALVELDRGLSWLAIGNLPRLLDQVPSGDVERLIGELNAHFDAVIVAPPLGELALMRRLAQHLESLIVVVSARAGMPREKAAETIALGRPVALVLRTP